VMARCRLAGTNFFVALLGAALGAIYSLGCVLAQTTDQPAPEAPSSRPPSAPASTAAPASSSPSAPLLSPSAISESWSLQGSAMRLVIDGKRRIISYEVPRAPLLHSGMQQGTVFFVGEQEGRTYRGTAHAFRQGCKPLPYPVEGKMSDNQRHLKLQGKRPQVDDSSCDVRGYIDHSVELIKKQ
jgi:hypothetical protein